MGMHHARNYHNHPNASLVAVVDADATRGGEVADRYHCAYYPSVRELLNSAHIKAASVAVPTHQHLDVAGELLQEGIHTLVEKPLAPTLQECHQLCRLAQKNEAILMVGHIERFNPAIRKLHAIIKEGVLGQVTSIITRRVGLAPLRIRDADVVTDLAVHDIDVANFLMGRPPMEVYANSGRGRLHDRIDFSEIFLNYGSANAVISVNWLTPIKIRKLSITGTRGYAELDFIRQELLLFQPPDSDTFKDFTDFVEKYGHDQVVRVPIEMAEPLAMELDHFLHCVESGSEPEVGCAEASEVLKVVERVTHMTAGSTIA
jgi:UDP-N-acetylglucosamine 3-dehydrogenase